MTFTNEQIAAVMEAEQCGYVSAKMRLEQRALFTSEELSSGSQTLKLPLTRREIAERDNAEMWAVLA